MEMMLLRAGGEGAESGHKEDIFSSRQRTDRLHMRTHVVAKLSPTAAEAKLICTREVFMSTISRATLHETRRATCFNYKPQHIV